MHAFTPDDIEVERYLQINFLWLKLHIQVLIPLKSCFWTANLDTKQNMEVTQLRTFLLREMYKSSLKE